MLRCDINTDGVDALRLAKFLRYSDTLVFCRRARPLARLYAIRNIGWYTLTCRDTPPKFHRVSSLGDFNGFGIDDSIDRQ